MNRQEFVEGIEVFYKDCIDIIWKKNKDYAQASDPFLNFYTPHFLGITSPERALLVRLCDKVQRVTNLLEKDPDVVEESVEDTLKDLANYSAILFQLLKSRKHATTILPPH